MIGPNRITVVFLERQWLIIPIRIAMVAHGGENERTAKSGICGCRVGVRSLESRDAARSVMASRAQMVSVWYSTACAASDNSETTLDSDCRGRT
jgi:hypothetical protein